MDMNMTTTAANTYAAVSGQKTGQSADVNVERNAVYRKTADDFESFFMYQVLELMTPEPDEDNLFGGGFAEEQWRHQLNEETAKSMTQKGGVGISDHIYNQLIKMQENQI